MRNWGIVVTVFYTVIVLGLLLPGAVFLAGGQFSDLREVYTQWLCWIPIGAVVSGQALLLFLAVDTSRKRLKPRAHILVSCSSTAMLLSLLVFATIFSLAVGVFGDKILNARLLNSEVKVLGWWGLLWLFWGVLFYRYFRDSSREVTRAISWLLKGSVLELLVAVPCHVVVRRRDDCSAPTVTAFGIATGIAVMLLSFGPSVLLLYKKRLDAYSTRGSATE